MECRTERVWAMPYARGWVHFQGLIQFDKTCSFSGAKYLHFLASLFLILLRLTGVMPR
jgi:hypothetical protein